MSRKKIAWWSTGTIVVILLAALPLGYAMKRAQSRARSINCASQMISMCYAAQLWATDHGEFFAPNFLAMTNELCTPKIMHCPADSSRLRVASWSDYSITNCSYEWMAPGATNDSNDKILVRCSIHGHLGYADCTVFDGVGRRGKGELLEPR